MLQFDEILMSVTGKSVESMTNNKNIRFYGNFRRIFYFIKSNKRRFFEMEYRQKCVYFCDLVLHMSTVIDYLFQKKAKYVCKFSKNFICSMGLTYLLRLPHISSRSGPFKNRLAGIRGLIQLKEANENLF